MKQSAEPHGLTAAALCGRLPEQEHKATEVALEDFRHYWERSYGAGSFLAEPPVDVHILIGSSENNPEIASLEKTGKLEDTILQPESFALDILAAQGKRLAVLRAPDKLGLQYSIYAFAERFLGIRFAHPLFEVWPDDPPSPEELHLVETPSMPLRILYETAHAAGGMRGTTTRRSHFSDVGAWRWEDWAYNPERMRHFVAWAVKNRQNVVLFDDVFLGIGGTSPSQAVWEYMDLRGIKTILNVHPGNAYTLDPDASEEDLCERTDLIGREYARTYCTEKKGFWRLAEKRLKTAQKHVHRLAGLVCYWDEGATGWGADESADTGDACPSISGRLTDTCATRYVRPKLHKSGCLTCGHIPNAAKWAKVVQYMNGPDGSVSRGLPPVGNGRAHSGIADPDDDLVAREVSPHLAPGSLSLVYCLPNCNRADRVEAWPRLLDEANAEDEGGRKILLVREYQYGCLGDIPLVTPSTLDSIDVDFGIMTKYRSTATCTGGVYVLHSMGWLYDWYSMRKQWNTSTNWPSWLRSTLAQVLGSEASGLAVNVMEMVRDVELYDGLESGEYVNYYSLWGIDPHRLAPETIPLPNRVGPFAYYTDSVRYVRLVAPGARDTEGLYTTSNLAPAERRLLALRGKLDRADSELKMLESLLPVGPNRGFWEEYLIRPLDYTIAFLRSRTAIGLSYCKYTSAQELARAGEDPSPVVAQGETLCRQALDEQDRYIRLRPGFASDYPKEIRQDVIRHLIRDWSAMRENPTSCRDLDLCAFLERAESGAGEWVAQDVEQP